jgi:hypothetical protein
MALAQPDRQRSNHALPMAEELGFSPFYPDEGSDVIPEGYVPF